MIKTEYITTLDQIFDLIAEQKYDPAIQRNRSTFLYRGMPNVDYKLKTSLQRNCKHKRFDTERSILRNFTKYAAIEKPQLKASVWQQMTIGQHHGLPTRLLDWTYSPMIGLHFATSGEDIDAMDKHDCVVWKIDIKEVIALLPEKYKARQAVEKTRFFTIDMLTELVKDVAEYDEDMGRDSIVFLEPPSIDERIVNQYSYFSVIPMGIEDIEAFFDQKTNHTIRYVIDKSLRWRIRDMLDQMNINERIMYPGLDGISSWLKRYYYVKEEDCL